MKKRFGQKLYIWFENGQIMIKLIFEKNWFFKKIFKIIWRSSSLFKGGLLITF